MATHDYIISNASGAAVRADLNNALAAIASNNSSSTEPTTTYAYQWWADTGSSPTVMKLRNAANSAWITLFQLDGEWSLIPFENGTAAAPSIYFKDSGTDTGIFSPGTDQVGISAGGTSRFEISTSATTSTLPVVHPLGAVATPSITFTGDLNTGIWSPAADTVAASTGGSERLRITSTGAVGIGTTSPSTALDVSGELTFSAGGAGWRSAAIKGIDEGGSFRGGMAFYTHPTAGSAGAPSERARIDSSGRLLVGTTSYTGEASLAIKASSAGSGTQAQLVLQRGQTNPAPDLTLGVIKFADADSTGHIGAEIAAQSDGGFSWASGDYPTRLVFSTTADGASSPTERWRIDSSGSLVGVAGSAFVAPYVYNTTTATGANVNVDASGFLRRSTSSIKYKTNVETIQDQYADAILGCRPVWYQSTCEADKPEWGHWGFIAEEVAEIDPRLCFFKEEEDGTLEPEGVQYDRLVPHLLNLIKRQSEAIAELQAEVAALKAN